MKEVCFSKIKLEVCAKETPNAPSNIIVRNPNANELVNIAEHVDFSF